LALGELLVYSGKNGKPEPILLPIFESARASDLACFRISDEAEERLPGVLGVLAYQMLVDYATISDDVLFLQGFPQERSHGLANGVYSDAMPFATQEGSSAEDWFDPDLYIAVAYRGEGAKDAKGREVRMPIAGGFSGSLLWKSNRIGREEWTPDDARVIGVLTHWKTGALSLVASRSSLVRQFLANVDSDTHRF